jgi:aryl-alcohol dehydrogenase-like predicted oxidoreductase
MGMSGMYGATDDTESLATIHAALDAGVNLLDTGDFYGMGQNEMLLGRALRFMRQQVVLSVKFGAQRAPNGAWLGFDARPAAVKTALAYSLKRLGVDFIDIYRPSRLDPTVPIEDTIGAIAEMVKAGYVRHIGLSEVGPETIRRAAAVHPIVDLQIEYALVSRSPEAKIFPALTELGIGATTYGTLSRGLLSGSQPAPSGDFRAYTLYRRQPGTKPATCCKTQGDRRGQGRYACAVGHCLGAGQGQLYRSGGGRAHAGATGREPGRARSKAHRRGACGS